MRRTQACLAVLSVCCGFGHSGWAEEASCPMRYDPDESWLGAFRCEKGDVLAVYFEREDEADAPRVAASFCELAGITLFRTNEITALICRYRGGQRRPREAMGQNPSQGSGPAN